MKTIIVDDEIMAIKLVRNYLERDKRVEIVGECLDAGEALQCVRERAVEAAFLDICIHGCMDGVELGKKLKELNPQIVLIYTTGNAQYAFAGDYMLEYSWAEDRMASLSRFLQN